MEKKHFFSTRWLAKIVSGPNTFSGYNTFLAYFLPFYLAKNIFPIIQLDKQTSSTKKNHNMLQKVLDIVSSPCYNRIINANDQQKKRRKRKMTIQTMTIINLVMLSATIVITLLFGSIAAFLPIIINAIDECRYNAAKRRPALRINAKLRRRVSNRPSKRLSALAAAGLVTLNKQATSVSQRRQQAARTYRDIITTAKHKVKRFNAPKRLKIKRSTQNPTTTINHQPIASPAASKEVKRFIARIINASNIDTVYRNWVESTDDMGFNIEIYNAYKSRKAVLATA